MAPLIAPCPRGSYISRVRRGARFAAEGAGLWDMVAPGITPTPPVMTRVGIPSVWESTAWKTCLLRIARQERLGGLAHGLLLLGGQRQPGGAARAAVAAGDVHGQLDRLDELGAGVPAQQRVQRPV